MYAPDTAQGRGNSLKLSGTDLLSGVSYTIKNKNSGKLLDLYYGDTTDGTNIQQWTKLGGSAQEWRLVSADEDYFRIASMTDESKCAAVAGDASADGSNVELQAYTGADNQLWKLVKNGSYYGLVSKSSGGTKGLDVFEFSLEDGGNIDQWEYWGGDCQLWSITPVYPKVNEGNYTLTNASTGSVLGGEWSIVPAADGRYTLSGSGSNFTAELTGSKNGSYTISGDYFGGSEYVIEPAGAAKAVSGDVNADGAFNVADLVMLERYLLGAGSLTDREAADLDSSGRVNTFDLIEMREMLK